MISDLDLDLTICSTSNDPTLCAEMVISLRRQCYRAGPLKSTLVRTRENVLFPSDKLFPRDLAKVNQYIMFPSLILSCYQSEMLDEAYPLFLL